MPSRMPGSLGGETSGHGGRIRRAGHPGHPDAARDCCSWSLQPVASNEAKVEVLPERRGRGLPQLGLALAQFLHASHEDVWDNFWTRQKRLRGLVQSSAALLQDLVVCQEGFLMEPMQERGPNCVKTFTAALAARKAEIAAVKP